MNRRLLFASMSLVGLIVGSTTRQVVAHPGHTHDDGSPAPAVPAHLRPKIVQLNSGEFTIVRPPVAVAPDDDELLPANPIAAAPKADDAPVDESAVDTCNDGNIAASGVDPAIHRHFSPFAKSLKLRWDEQFYYVGSNGMPEHPMMIGITAWQQQVPLPQKYFDDNAWRIPLHPVPAKEPAMIKGRFLRGAIALGVNGIPIFNPQNNRGEVSYEIGELDEWGGHCGRADDYHYHIVPVHLEKIVGKDQPVAYALDGYPIYGYQDENTPDFAPLDRLSGHTDKDGNYHYHATKSYPYVIGGFYGEVVEREEQVDPQPRAQPVREALPQMRGAKIVDFKSSDPGKYELKYEVNGKPGYVRYAIAENGSVAFTFVDVNGETKTETFEPGRRRPGGGGGKGGPGGDRRPPRPGENPPPRPGENRPPRPGDQPPPRPNDNPPPKPNDSAGDEPRGPKPGEARKPWIAEHFAELDADKNGTLTHEEMEAEATRTFAAYDTDGDGKLVKSEYDRGGVRTAFAGFVRGHSAEIDGNGNETISKQELIDFAVKLFDKADRNRDGKTDVEESSMGGPGGKKQ